jgi:hypothetical protein
MQISRSNVALVSVARPHERKSVRNVNQLHSLSSLHFGLIVEPHVIVAPSSGFFAQHSCVYTIVASDCAQVAFQDP